jgi:hypothetical protein
VTLPVPLAVELRTSKRVARVTNQVRDLQFRTVAPGGFASVSVALDRPIAIDPDEIAQFGTLVVFDGRNGQTVAEGRLEDPARSAGADGQVYELSALGGRAHAQDITAPYIAIDKSLEHWDSRLGTMAYMQMQHSEDVSGNVWLEQQIPQNQAVAIGTVARWYYPLIYEAGQKLARIYFDRYVMGITSSNYKFTVYAQPDPTLASSDIAVDTTWSTTGVDGASWVVLTHFSNGQTVPEIRISRINSIDTSAADATRASVREPVVRAMLLNKDGTEVTSYTLNYVLGSWVVADLLGRRLTQFDGANARIDTTAHHIDQLAYPDPVTAEQILDDLMLIEPAYYWAAWETVAGKNRFEWRTWPTAWRYDATVQDDFRSPQSTADLYDAVTVRWRHTRGKIRRKRFTQTVPLLAAAGISREGYVDLGDEFASQANVDQVGPTWLAEHATTGNQGTLTIARPILDRDYGRMVMPWEIRPGHLIRVRGVNPRADSLNANTRDGVTIFRIVAVDYRQSDNAATLELDSYSPSQARAIAALRKAIATKRRR